MSIEQTNFGPQTYLGVKKLITFEQMRDKKTYEEAYGKIMTYMGTNNLQPSGPPTNIYFTWDEEKQETELGVAMPVGGVDNVDDPDLELMTIEASKAAKTVHMGDYANLKESHEALMNYLKENNLEFDKYAIEEYVTDPKSEPDQSKWMTNIYYTIK